VTTADWALVVSIFSLIVSLAGFVWNVWSKWIYPKPKISVRFNVMTMISPGHDAPDRLALHATNYGPGDVALQLAVARGDRSLWRFWKKPRFGALNPLKGYEIEESDGPFSGGLPKKLAVGESFSVYFTADVEWFNPRHNLTRFGFTDTFNRTHWCSRRDAWLVKRHLAQRSSE
jgi:hypothetical protein